MKTVAINIGGRNFDEFEKLSDDGSSLTLLLSSFADKKFGVNFIDRYAYQVLNEVDVVARFSGDDEYPRIGLYQIIDGSYQDWISSSSAFKDIASGIKFFAIVTSGFFIEVAAFDEPVIVDF